MVDARYARQGGGYSAKIVEATGGRHLKSTYERAGFAAQTDFERGGGTGRNIRFNHARARFEIHAGHPIPVIVVHLNVHGAIAIAFGFYTRLAVDDFRFALFERIEIFNLGNAGARRRYSVHNSAVVAQQIDVHRSLINAAGPVTRAIRPNGLVVIEGVPLTLVFNEGMVIVAVEVIPRLGDDRTAMGIARHGATAGHVLNRWGAPGIIF